VKKLSFRFLLALCTIFVAMTAASFYIFGVKGTRLPLSKTLAENQIVKTSSSSSYQADGEEEEVPHFNLFSIINKFIPH
jgi:hypothetical protein